MGKVALPDGRTQVVSYSVSGPEGGYVANVEYQGEAAYPDTVVKAQPVHAPLVVQRPVHAPLVVQRPVHTPLVVSRPVFHSAPLSVAPSSYSPVVHTRVLAHPAIRPLVHASPVVFHPVPSSAANSVTSSDDDDDEQEERKAKEALEVEETKSTIVSEDSGLSTEASQPTTTLAPTTQPPTTQPETTQTPSTQPPPKQPPVLAKTEELPQEVAPEEPVLVEGVPTAAPEDVNVVESQPQYYYYKFF